MITNHEIYERAIEKLESGAYGHICAALTASCGCGNYSLTLVARNYVKEEFLYWFLPEGTLACEPFFGPSFLPENKEARILALHFLILVTKRKTFK